MWELVELNKSDFSFKLLGTYNTLEEGINARTDMRYQFVLYCGPISTDTNQVKELVARIDGMHHNEIRIVLKSNTPVSGQFMCVLDGYSGPVARTNCYYWSDKKPGYGWIVDGGACK